MKYIVATVLFVFCSIPAAVGVVDMVWWFYTDHALSSIDWGASRVCFAYALASVGVLSVMGLTL